MTRTSAVAASSTTDRAAELVREAAAGTVHADGHVWRDAAVTAAVAVALERGDDDGVLALAHAYGSLLGRVPCAVPLDPGAPAGDVELVPVGIAERRRRGAFATPPELAGVLARHALPDGRVSDGVWGPHVDGAPGRTPTVVDPACGTGALLRAALTRLVELGVPVTDAVAAVHGVDDDPAAVAVCRAALLVHARRLAVGSGSGTGAAAPVVDQALLAALVAERVVVGDALLGATPSCPSGAGLVWDEAFPTVLGRSAGATEPVTGWRGGFDAVVANPPWERLKVARRDWAGLPPSQLRASRADAARTVRTAGRHPLTGAGEVNAYLPFVETCWRLLAAHGRAGLVVPAGIAADRSAAALVGALLSRGALERLHLLEPPTSLFEGVSARVGVAVLVLRSGSRAVLPPGRPVPTAQVAVGMVDATLPPGGRAWDLDASMPALVNPNTLTAPLFGSARDAEVVTRAYRRWPVLCRRSGGEIVDGPWQVRLVTPLHMTRDAKYFRTSPGPGLLPLWEAKHAGLLDHRGGARTLHRYWVPEEIVRERLGAWTTRGWLAGYRNVTTVDSPRTLVPCALPVAAVGNSLPLISAPRLPLLLSALASLPVDYLVRQKHAGANLNFFKLEQAALPRPQDYDVPAPWAPSQTLATWVLERFAAATPWDDDLAGLAAELTADGVRLPDTVPPDVRGERRRVALAELDAAHAVLLGWDRDDLEHVLTTFTALRVRDERTCGRFRTRDDVLAAYDRLTI